MASVWAELRRRNVVKVAVAYAIVGWLLVEVASVVLPTFKAPEWIMQVFTFLVIVGFPLALILAWAFELTPEGIKREKDVDRSQSITHITRRKLDYLIIAVLVLALGFFAFDKFVLDPSRDADLVQATTEAIAEQAAEAGKEEIANKSIAVLAFTDLSPQGDQEYFSDGISEELLNVLAKIPGLRVAARTSSFQFKGQNRDIVDIGQQLNVALILEGSVRKAGLQIRITAQLVDASNGFHLWSETYDRKLANIFAVQDEISAAIVGALKDHLGLQVEAAPRVIAAANTEAHDAYLRGRYLVVQRGRAGIEGAIGEFEQAIILDPEYALAHAELAMATLLLNQAAGLPVTEAIARATPYAERAMALDPDLASVGRENLHRRAWDRRCGGLRRGGGRRRGPGGRSWSRRGRVTGGVASSGAERKGGGCESGDGDRAAAADRDEGVDFAAAVGVYAPVVAGGGEGAGGGMDQGPGRV